MTAEKRVHAIMDFRFTERQARFLALVMRHAGVCVPRQYARFAGIAHGGGKCNAFFARLVRRGYAVESDCVHNRARLYRLHSKRLYYAIGEPNSRYRRPVPARGALERLMLLDAVLASPDLDWLASESEQAAFVATFRAPDPSHASPDTEAERESSESRSTFAGRYPIGLDPSGRAVLLYLATVPWTDEFRRFLKARAALLRVVPAWTLRLVFPRPVDRAYEAYQAVIRKELETPLPAISKALAEGTARVECVVLPHAYRHLAPVADHDHSAVGEVAMGLRNGTREGTRPPHALNPGPQPRRLESEPSVSEQLERDWHRLNEWHNAQKKLGLTP